jgi:hypothetical protein
LINRDKCKYLDNQQHSDRAENPLPQDDDSDEEYIPNMNIDSDDELTNRAKQTKLEQVNESLAPTSASRPLATKTMSTYLPRNNTSTLAQSDPQQPSTSRARPTSPVRIIPHPRLAPAPRALGTTTDPIDLDSADEDEDYTKPTPSAVVLNRLSITVANDRIEVFQLYGQFNVASPSILLTKSLITVFRLINAVLRAMHRLV